MTHALLSPEINKIKNIEHIPGSDGQEKKYKELALRLKLFGTCRKTKTYSLFSV